MNIVDYLKMRSDISFKYDPFNDVDNLCLCQCAYANIEKAIKNIEQVYSLSELSKIVWKGVKDEDILNSKSFVASSAFVLKELGESDRYKNVKIHHFVSKLDKKRNEQFSAMQFDIDKDLTFVAFRGTDSTIVGWKEDFKISYEITGAQKSAQEYLNTYINKKKKYIIGGHSKGGNLAEYGFLMADKKIQDKIIKVYSNDGPGLNKELLGDVNYKELYKKTIKIIPSYDFFGTIYDDTKIKHQIIKSSADFILQHDAMTWLIEANHFVKEDKTIAQSDVIKKGLNNFMNDVDIKHRKLFFEEFFVALDELNIDNVTDLNRVTILAFLKAIGKIVAMDDDSKRVALEFSDVIKDLVKYEADEAKEKIEKILVSQKDLFDDVISKSKKRK